MSRSGLCRSARPGSTFATASDFCRIFHDGRDNLYTLSLMLTADPHRAEECFVAGLDDCVKGNTVFRDWAKAWAKRTVIKNAIRMMSPRPTATIPSAGNVGTAGVTANAESCPSAIVQLPPFERFVYVLSVLEGYPDRECVVLLGCRVEEIIRSRTRALRDVAHRISAQCPDELVAAGPPPSAESATYGW
jgi:DNA-directed RNA polymerase specialized sigma24 family protein